MQPRIAYNAFYPLILWICLGFSRGILCHGSDTPEANGYYISSEQIWRSLEKLIKFSPEERHHIIYDLWKDKSESEKKLLEFLIMNSSQSTAGSVGVTWMDGLTSATQIVNDGPIAISPIGGFVNAQMVFKVASGVEGIEKQIDRIVEKYCQLNNIDEQLGDALWKFLVNYTVTAGYYSVSCYVRYGEDSSTVIAREIIQLHSIGGGSADDLAYGLEAPSIITGDDIAFAFVRLFRSSLWGHSLLLRLSKGPSDPWVVDGVWVMAIY